MPLEALLISENLTDSDSDGLAEAQVVILYFTVPTTCSRPSIEMVGFIYLFIYLCIYFSVFTPLTRPY